MNRYMADGLLADMRQGKRVLYLGPNRDQVRDVLVQLAPMLRTYEKARRAHGMEEVASPPTGGFIRLHSVGSSLRGLCPDVVVLDADPPTRQWEDLSVLMVRAELIRA